MPDLVSIIKLSRRVVARDGALFRQIGENTALTITTVNTNMEVQVSSVLDPRLLHIETIANLLVRDKRVDIEKKINTSVLRFLTWSLTGHIEDRLRGFEIGSEMAGRKVQRWNIGELLEENILLRYIILKRPSDVELLDWMIERRTKSFATAARRVMRDELDLDSDLVPIEALLLSILHPTLSLQDLIADLRDEGVSEDDVVRCAQLVGAHRGKEKLREADL